MSPDDKRLVAALTVLRDQLAPVVDEIAFGWLDAEDRRDLARALRTVADALAPPIASTETVVRIGHDRPTMTGSYGLLSALPGHIDRETPSPTALGSVPLTRFDG